MGSCRGAERSPEPSRGRGTRPDAHRGGVASAGGRRRSGPGEGAAFAARRSFTSKFPRRDPERQIPFRDSTHVRMKGGSRGLTGSNANTSGTRRIVFTKRRSGGTRRRDVVHRPFRRLRVGKVTRRFTFLMQHVNRFFKKRVKSFMMALFFFNIYFGPSYQDLPNIDFFGLCILGIINILGLGIIF